MKKDFYVEFRSAEEAETALQVIQETKGERWAEPDPDPFSISCVIPWNLGYLTGLEHLLEDKPRLSLDQAMKKGYTVGYHKGRFSQAAYKLEDAYFELDTLSQLYGSTDFPSIRALYYGFQSSIYGARQALGKSARRTSRQAKEWWSDVEAGLKREPLIEAMDKDYNRDKHGEMSGFLSPALRFYGYNGRRFDVISGEGAFVIENRGTPLERRRFLKLEAPNTMEVVITSERQVIRGIDVTGQPLPEKLKTVADLFSNLVHEARQRFDP